MVSRA